MNLKNPTGHEISQIVAQIGERLEAGDSISVARKHVCGNNFSSKNRKEIMRKITTHPVYVRNLNEYLVRIGKGFQYRFENGRLVAGKSERVKND